MYTDFEIRNEYNHKTDRFLREAAKYRFARQGDDRRRGDRRSLSAFVGRLTKSVGAGRQRLAARTR